MARRSHCHSRTWKSALAACAASSASLAAPFAHAAHSFDISESAFRASYAATPIDLDGAVVDEAGAPIEGALVTAIGWGSSGVNDGEIAFTDANGGFVMPSLARRSVLLRVEADGYYTEIIPTDLHRPLAEGQSDAGAVVLSRARPGRARLIVGGDTMFGRRFVDYDGDGIEGEAEDLIRPATRAADARALFTFMRDVLSSADYTQINLESQVTTHTATPHPYKDFTFFSYPETMSALTFAGIDGVSLGNNHMYDYLEPGITETLSAVPNAGLDWFGAGLSKTLAKGAVLYRTLGGGVDVAFQGFSQIVNDGTTLPEYSLVAADGPPLTKGGALEMSTSNINDFMTLDVGSRFAIPVLHGGTEYSDYPTSGMRSRFIQLLQRGAGLVVAHHPHVAHGVGLYNTASGPKYVFMSLGNLLFEQDVFETFQSYVAAIDIDQIRTGVYSVHRVQLVPYHIEGYVPKLVSSRWLARAGRTIGHLSTTLPAAPAPGAASDGLFGAAVFPSGPRVVAASAASQYTTSSYLDIQSVRLTGGNTGPIAYSRASASDMLAAVHTNSAASCDYGREIMLYGDFEDQDVDDEFQEGSMWPVSTARYIEGSVVHSGAGAMVMTRKYNSSGSTSVYMGNRVRFPAGRKLTLTGYLKGNNAGPLRVEIYWYTTGGSSISNSVKYTRTPGTYDWERFTIDLTPPSNAGSVRAYFRSDPPTAGEASTFLDDLSLIEWEGTAADASTGVTFATPNDWSYLRCTAASSSLTSIGLTLTHRLYALAPATP